MARRTINRRRFVTSTAALSSAMVAAPFVRGAYAAGKLAVGSGTTGCQAPTRAPRRSPGMGREGEGRPADGLHHIAGQQAILTAAAEAQARSGHDILSLGSWDCARYSDQLVPVDDIMASLVKQNGAASAITTYLGKIDGKWLGVPATPAPNSRDRRHASTS